MAQTPAAPERPFSPCTGDCVTDAHTGVCRSCHRTLREVAHWATMSEAERERVWQRIERLQHAERGQPPA